MSDSNSSLLAKLKSAIDAVVASMSTHQTWWIGTVGTIIVAVTITIAVVGVGPGGKAICTATLAQAKDFGVIPMSASLSSTSAKSTGVKDRKECTAQADGDSYRLVVDITPTEKGCKDLKGPDCVRLYTVARTDGMVTYQVREIPPDESDAAVEAREAQGAGGMDAGAPGGGDTDASGLGSVAPADNSGGSQAGSQDSQGGSSNDQPPPQQ